jgi:ornithine cyclodeaminase/alanine dehydrogenase-like protein (mu-crystallin family)
MTDVLVLNEHEVEELLDMEGCIAAMEQALSSLARGEVHLPLRPVVRPPGANSFLGLMPVHRGGGQPLYGLKTVAVFPDNPSRGLDSHQGTVTLYDGETGQLRAVMNASPITAIRTAGCSAVATRLLARDDARELAVIGAGHQARPHIEAIGHVRDLARIRIVSRSAENAERLAAQFENADVAGSVEEAVRNADVVITVTNSAEPVLKRDWLKDGVHINAVGACFPNARELDSATVAVSSFFVDRRESAENEAGDYLLALKEGVIAADHIRGEIGELLVGETSGRTSAEEITVFESLGLAVEDLFAAEYLVRRARETGRGTTVDF